MNKGLYGRLFHSIKTLFRDDEKTLRLSCKNFLEWIIRNLGKAGVKFFSDIFDSDWAQLLYVEPVNVRRPQLIKAGSVFSPQGNCLTFVIYISYKIWE